MVVTSARMSIVDMSTTYAVEFLEIQHVSIGDIAYFTAFTSTLRHSNK